MILSVTEARAYVSSSLTDEALLELLIATERDISEVAPATATEYLAGGYGSLVLSRPAGTISDVIEDIDGVSVTLDATDYRIEGQVLRRLTTGTHSSAYWQGLVKVQHVPTSGDVDHALRVRAQVALLQLETTTAAGVASERIGDYAVSYGMTKGPTYAEQKAAILASLQPVMVR